MMINMNILIFNWKDIKNPEAGGAEVYTHEIFKRIVKKGNNVVLFTSEFDGCKRREEIDGIEVIRSGTRFNPFNSVYNNAKKFYKKGEFDVVIDEVNTKPFMTVDFVDEPLVCLIHQLAREYWDYKTPFPVNYIGRYILENNWLKKYRDVKTITVSKSTVKDLEELGFKDISIVHNGLNGNVLKKLLYKEKEFTLLFVGRLTPSKKPEDAIKAFLKFGKGKLWIVGRGELKNKLEKKYKSENIIFKGFVSNEEKIELMGRAHVILVPGIREGWGRVVTEANALGTPAIGYDVPGLRDSIRDRKTGLLCDRGIDSMAETIKKLFNDDKLREELSKNAFKYSKNFNWEKTADETLEILRSVIDGSS